MTITMIVVLRILMMLMRTSNFIETIVWAICNDDAGGVKKQVLMAMITRDDCKRVEDGHVYATSTRGEDAEGSREQAQKKGLAKVWALPN